MAGFQTVPAQTWTWKNHRAVASCHSTTFRVGKTERRLHNSLRLLARKTNGGSTWVGKQNAQRLPSKITSLRSPLPPPPTQGLFAPPSSFSSFALGTPFLLVPFSWGLFVKGRASFGSFHFDHFLKQFTRPCSDKVFHGSFFCLGLLGSSIGPLFFPPLVLAWPAGPRCGDHPPVLSPALQ